MHFHVNRRGRLAAGLESKMMTHTGNATSLT